MCRTGPLTRARGAAGLVAATWLAAAASHGQDVGPAEGGPIIISPRPQLELFQLEEIHFAFEAEWRRDVDEVDPRVGPVRRDTETRYEEFLEIATRGFVGHPNLVELNLAGRFGLRQRYLDLEGSSTERINDSLINYDLSALLLKNTKTPLTLYLRQTENDVNRQFAGDLTDTVSEYGVRALIKTDVGPLRIEAFRREQDQVDRSSQDEFSLDQDSILFDGQVELDPRSTLVWDYTFDDIDQSGRVGTSRSFQRHEANVTHTVNFGAEEDHQLRSSLRYYNESGDPGLEQIRLQERLRLQHAERLQSWIDYTEERIRRSGFEQRHRDLQLTVRHQLFESLTTVVEVGGRQDRSPTDDFSSDEIFGSVNLDYTKRVPGGRILGGLQYGYNHTDASDRGVPLQVIDQVFTFSPVDLIRIDRRNIVPLSIVITDLAGTTVYAEGLDYTVQAFPDSVLIQRLITGIIAPGQTVLIDYEIGPQPGGVTTTDIWGVELRYTIEQGAFRGLSIYSRYFNQDQTRSFDIDDPLFAADDFTSWVYGLEYNIGRISLTAEQEMRDSSLAPFDRTRFEGRYVNRFGRDKTLILTAQYQEIDRTEEDFRTATTVLSGELAMQLSTRLRGSLLVQWRDENGNAGFNSQAFEQELDLRWNYGQTSVYARLRNSFIDSSINDTTLQTFVVGLRREF